MAAKAIDRLKNVSEFDRKQVEKAEELFGPEPDTMGFFKNLHWGRIREELVFPYPEVSAEEKLRCDALIENLDHYMKNEHPSFQVDQQQEIPQAAIDKLFEMGVMGMIIPQEYGGGGYSVTSYNRALECIGRYCGSTAVMVSAHQSIGCGALVIFGTEAQKKRWLYPMGNTTLSAFCLSEPDVGCDAGGQRTTCRLSEDGTHFILNGEKKWATSGALSGMFTVMAKQTMTDAKSGKEKEAVTALICTPDMEGVDIFSRNRSKCGIRGTWQARIRFTDVKVPVENVLHEQGRGLVVALTCLNYGRCTLSAGMVGAAKAAFEQSVKWAKYRYQFEEPIGAFEQVQEKVAKMAAYIHALDSMLYMTTGIVGRKDEDLMLETAACKTFCSEYGFRVVDNALQIMGGEGYMTENVVERLWRDSRINIIVEGANEVMYSFLFGYGGKQLGESMLDIKANPLKSPIAALKIAAQLFLGVKPAVNRIGRLDSSLDEYRDMLERRTQELSHEVKLAFKDHGEKLLARQMIQRRLAMAAVWVYAMFCSVSKLDQTIRVGKPAKELERERQIVRHVCALGNEEIDLAYLALHKNVDKTMRETAPMIMDWIDELPNSEFSIPESSPTEAKGSGYKMNTADIPQFGSGSMYVEPVEKEKEKEKAKAKA